MAIYISLLNILEKILYRIFYFGRLIYINIVLCFSKLNTFSRGIIVAIRYLYLMVRLIISKTRKSISRKISSPLINCVDFVDELIFFYY